MEHDGVQNLLSPGDAFFAVDSVEELLESFSLLLVSASVTISTMILSFFEILTTLGCALNILTPKTSSLFSSSSPSLAGF
jgi:hypothetical protein